MKLHSTLESLCKQKGLTLAALARLSGVPKQTLHNWTLGQKSVNPDQIRRVSIILGVSVHYMLFDEHESFECRLSLRLL